MVHFPLIAQIRNQRWFYSVITTSSSEMPIMSFANWLACYYDLFCAHFMSSARGLQPITASITNSKKGQNRSFSNGQFSQPVVMQKYVSCGATWWIRWCLLGRMILCSWSQTTHSGSPKYVCDHLWIWNINRVN